ncbi:MAG TPA: ergothioneine biosynthesis protein EgtB [Allosphingosinicella sp.]
MATHAMSGPAKGLSDRYQAVRRLSLDIAAPLSDADATIQPMPDASPAKWHLAHTTWFFETFLMRDHVPGYRLFDEGWAYLFNSYYEGEGERHARARRGMLSRPSLDEIRAYRAHVDRALLGAFGDLPPDLIELGLNHEQQHQELMLMDLLATFAANPLCPPAWPAAPAAPAALPGPAQWKTGPEGVVEIGAEGEGFAFDCERPRHKVFLPPHALADRLVTNAEWLEFIADGGYAEPLLWLADGWAWVQEQKVEAPLYWHRGEGGWQRFGLDGLQPLAPAEPVCHVSYYEADAFARWAGARLPTEGEWEAAAAPVDPASGNQLDRAGPVRPTGAGGWYGDAWTWTMSGYLPYPGFRPAPGAVGEYNGKFMCSQMVLRGGSCATPRGHMRASYRNFFYPHQRWMFAGLRLAKDL